MMKNWTSLILFLLSILVSFSVRSEIVRVKYRVRKVESLAQIYKKFIDLDNIIHADQEFVKFTIEVNDQVMDWSKIKKGTVISLFLDDDFMKKRVYAKFRKERNTPYSEKLARSISSNNEMSFEKKLDYYRAETSYSLFYMASSGAYSQDTDNTSDTGINFNQDSPVSLGGMVAHKFRPKWSLTGGGYYSQFDDSVFDGKSSPVPSEYGGNIYGYFSGLKGVGLYGGLDYERMSSFSLQDLINNKNLSYDQHDFFHLTGGIDFFKIWKKKLYLIKFALSMNMFSKTTSNFVNSGKDFSGIRYLAYINAPITKNVFIHGLLKYHDFSDQEKIQILRLGFGGGIRF